MIVVERDLCCLAVFSFLQIIVLFSTEIAACKSDVLLISKWHQLFCYGFLVALHLLHTQLVGF